MAWRRHKSRWVLSQNPSTKIVILFLAWTQVRGKLQLARAAVETVYEEVNSRQANAMYEVIHTDNVGSLTIPRGSIKWV